MPTAPPPALQTTAPARPYLKVQCEPIPAFLKAIPNWVCWGAGKVPKTIWGRNASSTDPATWTTFQATLAAYERGGFHGIGFVLDGTPATPDGMVIAAVDLDHITDDESRRTRARDLIEEFQSYAEWSPSGTGVHIFCLAHPLRSGINQDGVELYTSGRFLTVTGHAIGVGDV